jgi:DNA-directed RNA polymerase subunit RPC12/RpoP
MDSCISEKVVRCYLCKNAVTIYNSSIDKDGNVICDKCNSKS